jgi:hypothetical protein
MGWTRGSTWTSSERLSRKPLGLYARLELGIALSSALTPLLLAWASFVYITLGGTVSPGMAGATVVHLLLARAGGAEGAHGRCAAGAGGARSYDSLPSLRRLQHQYERH